VQSWALAAVGLLAAVIGGMQWWTARQKLVLDLFDKRFQVFLDVRKIASEAIQLGKLQQPGSVNEVVARGRFLFGEDIQTALITLHRLTGEMEAGRINANNEVGDHFDHMLPLFERYLKMDQQSPKFPLLGG
jgi:hypothetical protein